ncbi:MAG: hypothetical protein ACR2IJ_09115 [Fluviibacter sp.]
MTTSIEISTVTLNSIQVTSAEPPIIEVQQVAPASIEVSLATIGPKGEQGLQGVPGVGIQGIQGIPGPNTIGGYGFQLAALSVGDHLRFAGNFWENTSSTSLTDGGNF